MNGRNNLPPISDVHLQTRQVPVTLATDTTTYFEHYVTYVCMYDYMYWE